MTQEISISLLIPAYNEEKLIAETIAQVQRSFTTVAHSAYEIVVCNNNSTDRTAAIAEAQGARVVFEP
ncbi:MAG TPA: glycosyltransferase, partial [Chthoniobacteraceae bacterium]|nr:glycosyltransferase [Chthoniobacteraceae bacterium]